MRNVLIVAAVLLATVPANAQRNRQPEISVEALKAMQTHDVNVDQARAFSAIVSALVDRNYKVDTAVKDAGLITATENTKSKMSGIGMVTRQNTIKLSIIVAPLGEKTSRIRINAVDNYVYTYAGKVHRDENTPVSNQKVYQDLFAAIDSAL